MAQGGVCGVHIRKIAQNSEEVRHVTDYGNLRGFSKMRGLGKSCSSGHVAVTYEARNEKKQQKNWEKLGTGRLANVGESKRERSLWK